MNLCDIQNGMSLSGFYLLKQASLRTTAAGKPYLAGLLTDRTGTSFPVVKAPGCRNEIFNSKKIFLADKQSDWAKLGLWAGRLYFTTENAVECVQVMERYMGKGRFEPNEFTRGLYYRVVE